MFQSSHKTIIIFADIKDTILELESKRLSNQIFTCASIKFKGSSLKQEDEAPFTPKNMANLFVVHELDTWP